MDHNKTQGLRALVVEDSIVTQRLMSMFLERMGFELRFVENGKDALEIAQNEIFDIVFLDVMIPIIDGYGVCKKLKANTRTKDIPVVMLTSKDGMFDKVRGKMAGTDIYLTKPIVHTQLLAAVTKFFPMRQGRVDIAVMENKNETIDDVVTQKQTIQQGQMKAQDLALKQAQLQKEQKQQDLAHKIAQTQTKSRAIESDLVASQAKTANLMNALTSVRAKIKALTVDLTKAQAEQPQIAHKLRAVTPITSTKKTG